MRQSNKAFTLAELLIAVAVLVLLVVLMSQLVSSAASLMTTGHKRMDADTQVRQLFDRMAVDLAQIIKRSDVDCYVKGLDPENGNDRIAFFSHVPGYYPPTGSQSPTSLVAYRVNAKTSSSSYNKMERMGKGLLWNGVSGSDLPLIFGPTPTLQNNWPSATTADPNDANYSDTDYETIGPNVFRFEYFYQLTDGTFANSPAAAGVTSLSALSVCIAVVDPKSKVLLSDSQIATLAGKLGDYSAGSGRGALIANWQDVLNNTKSPDPEIAAMPRAALASIRLYERDFFLR
jgi:prepilin-type N-terminal cleavage/methylation domain-containing protein